MITEVQSSQVKALTHQSQDKASEVYTISSLNFIICLYIFITVKCSTVLHYQKYYTSY